MGIDSSSVIVNVKEYGNSDISSLVEFLGSEISIWIGSSYGSVSVNYDGNFEGELIWESLWSLGETERSSYDDSVVGNGDRTFQGELLGH